MDKFWDLLEKSVILQGMITLLVIGTWAAMLVLGREIPDGLTFAVTTVLGFFFGSKSAMMTREYASAQRKK